MNIVTDRDKYEQTVSSKYFSTKSDMDESLTDFQEPKKLAGPKTAIKKTVQPIKSRKALKRIHGQKDIRKALQTKHELESYSKDFDNVCRQAGLDVDSEQLQLAIALSKSLQDSASSSGNNPGTSQPLYSQDRVGRIRTTLLEYGFKVPEIKTKITKRLKKRKHYKLLETSEEAKKQIIADNYSKVLFENIILSRNSQNIDIEVGNVKLYNLTTNVTYSVLKSIDTFYVEGLLEKSTSTGNLLRDWSEIPGRPVSPKLTEPSNMNFSEIECSQIELDVVLSGSLQSCKSIIKTKENKAIVSVSDKKELVRSNILDKSVIVLIDGENLSLNNIKTMKMKEIEIMNPQETKYSDKSLKENYTDILEKPTGTINQCRSFSPDLFDDEPSTVIDETVNQFLQEKNSPLHDISKAVTASNKVRDLTEYDQNKIVELNYSINTNVKTQQSQITNVTSKFNDFMEITECVDIQYVATPHKTSPLKLSQNVATRKSNDFMEITNCIVPVVPIEGDIDLTQSPDKGSGIVVLGPKETRQNYEALPETFEVEDVEDNIDGIIEETISKHSSDKRKQKIMSVIEENNIDLTESPKSANNAVENMANKSVETLDLTQSSDTSDELPFISLKTNKNVQSADETIIMDPKDYEEMKHNAEILYLTQNVNHKEIHHVSQKSHKSDSYSIQQIQSNEMDSNVTDNEQSQEDILDLTQEIVITSRRNSKSNNTNISFFEDYIHNHSDNDVHDDNFNRDSMLKDKCLDVDEVRKQIDIESLDNLVTQNVKIIANSSENYDVDLTQTLESSEELSQNFQKSDHCALSEHYSETGIEMEVDKGSQSDIDLTQQSDSEELSEQSLNNNYFKDQSINEESEVNNDATIETKIFKSSQRYSSLGKKDDVSVDYDELYDNLLNRHSNSQISRSSQSADHNVSKKSKDTSNCSQNSEVFVISDNELDYSMHKSKLEKPLDNFLFGGLSIMDEFSDLSSFRRSTDIENKSVAANKNPLPTEKISEDGNINQIEIERDTNTPVKYKRVDQLATPQKPNCSGLNTVVTPCNSQYSIKTNDITPMPKYEAMTLEELHSELDKIGVKPFKRKRAVQLLTHIYNQTHPTVESCSDEESPCKKRRTNDYDSPKQSTGKLTCRKILSPKKTARSPRKDTESKKSPKNVPVKKRKENSEDRVASEESRPNIIGVLQGKNHEVHEKAVIKGVDCSPDDWVFQKREKAKVHSCRVPLHIAFHNYVLSRPRLREAILCYEPINIDEVHKDLVAYGHRYDPKDLLKFMDKKCITVKTTDNNARNHKR